MTALENVPARKIVRAIAGAAQRWSDADFPARLRATDRIVERTGYSVPVVEYALDRLFFSITDNELAAVIRSEIGSLEALDGFAPRERRPDAWARPLGSVCVISSRTTIGVALVPAIFALCAKCDVLVKDREDALAAAYFVSLAEELPDFSEAARADRWTAGAENAPELRAFDGLVAFGNDETLVAIAASLSYSTRFIGYGSRASVGYVCREALCDDNAAAGLAEGAARDLVLYESEGCLSLHALFVERGGNVSPEAFARTLTAAVERANVEFPLGNRDASRTARLAHQRETAAFRAASGTGAVYANEDADYMLAVDPPADEPPQFLPRSLGILSVDDPREALAYLRRHRLPLEGFALAGARADAMQMAIEAGAARIARFGELQHPPLGGDHGGRGRISDFVRWIDNTL